MYDQCAPRSRAPAPSHSGGASSSSSVPSPHPPPCVRTLWPRQASPPAAYPPASALRSKHHQSSDDREQTVPAHADRPAPELPCLLASIDGEENQMRFADEVLRRHVAAVRRYAAVAGIVAVVAHHEVMAFRHDIHRGVVVIAVIDAIEGLVGNAVRQRFLPLLDARGRIARTARI